MLYKDSQGNSATLAGAICGGIFGFLGAVISELQDDENGGEEGIRWDKVVECTLSGAATGAASGFVADVSIATFGVVPAMGIAAAAGGVFSGLNSAYVQNTLSGEIDSAKVASDVFLGSVSNGLCTGTSAAFEPTAKGIWDGVRLAWNQIDAELIPGLMNTGSFLVNDFLPTAITGFFAWFGGMEYDAIVN